MGALGLKRVVEASYGLLQSRDTSEDNNGQASSPSSVPTPSSSTAPSSPSSGPGTGQMVLIIIAASLFVLIGSVSIFVMVRRRRRSIQTETSPKASSLFSRFRSGSNRGEYSSQLQLNASRAGEADSLSQSDTRNRDVEMELVNDNANSRNIDTNNESGVNRHTSVRSIMTLPPYSASAQPTEQVLGREGERAGIDLVIEQPETLDEEEERREEEMASLYQIRQARRREAAEREERRRARREARQRGDTEALNRMQQESRQRQQQQQEGVTLSAQLIAEHQAKNRERRVSSVQYQDVGVARHDGSRVRNTSIDSDNRPLLSSAASISGTAAQGSRASLSLHQHGRDRSTTSFQSISSVDSNSSDAPILTNFRNHDFEVIPLDTGRTRSHSTVVQPENAESAPPEPPPTYEDAPPYESPTSHTNPGLPRIPSIRVSPTLPPIPSSPHPS